MFIFHKGTILLLRIRIPKSNQDIHESLSYGINNRDKGSPYEGCEVSNKQEEEKKEGGGRERGGAGRSGGLVGGGRGEGDVARRGGGCGRTFIFLLNNCDSYIRYHLRSPRRLTQRGSNTELPAPDLIGNTELSFSIAASSECLTVTQSQALPGEPGPAVSVTGPYGTSSQFLVSRTYGS
eukprot:768276-Hanusia_phi.AAC.3